MDLATQKRCTRCKTWKTTEEFGRDRSRGDGLCAKCRECARACDRESRSVPHPPRALLAKYCPTCGAEKPIIEFSTNTSRLDGFASHCLKCVRASSKKHYAKNAEAIKAKTTADRRKRTAAGSTRERDYASGYRLKMAGVVRWEMSRRRTDARCRARARGLPFAVTIDELVELWESQEGLCVLSGLPMHLSSEGQNDPWIASLDRIDSRGGYTIENLRLVVWMANRALAAWGDSKFMEMCHAVVNNAKA